MDKNIPVGIENGVATIVVDVATRVDITSNTSITRVRRGSRRNSWHCGRWCCWHYRQDRQATQGRNQPWPERWCVPVGIYNDPYIRWYFSISIYEKRIVCRSSARRLYAPVGNADNETEVDNVAADVTRRVCSTSAVGVGCDRRNYTPVGTDDIVDVAVMAVADDTTRGHKPRSVGIIRERRAP